MSKYFYYNGLGCLLLFLSGCSWLVPTYERPTMDMPEKWKTSVSSTEEEHKEVSQNWWQNYKDPFLQSLIQEALKYSDDLKISVAKLQQVHAQYDFAFRNQFPMIAATGFASRLKANFNNNSLNPLLNPLLTDKTANASFVGGMLSYEVDLWGKLANQNQMAKASYFLLTIQLPCFLFKFSH